MLIEFDEHFDLPADQKSLSECCPCSPLSWSTSFSSGDSGECGRQGGVGFGVRLRG